MFEACAIAVRVAWTSGISVQSVRFEDGWQKQRKQLLFSPKSLAELSK